MTSTRLKLQGPVKEETVTRNLSPVTIKICSVGNYDNMQAMQELVPDHFLITANVLQIL